MRNIFNKIKCKLRNAKGQQTPYRCITENNKHVCADVKRKMSMIHQVNEFSCFLYLKCFVTEEKKIYV